MKQLFIVIAAILVVSVFANHEEWKQFKVKHEKTYKNSAEESFRYSIFLDTLQEIAEHNARYQRGEETYFMGVNEFADMTYEEFHEWNSAGYKRPSEHTSSQKRKQIMDVGVKPPDAIDWRELGQVSEVLKKEKCGSSWAIGAAGSIEGQLHNVNKSFVPVSPQEIVDCASEIDTLGCQGGTPDGAFSYVRDHGIGSADDYPYIDEKSDCHADPKKRVAKVSYTVTVDKYEDALKYAVGIAGPVVAEVNSKPLKNYQGGIFQSDDCHSDVFTIDTVVLVVGYGVENDQPFWILKSTHGKEWGEDGYFRLARNAHQCGIALETNYPVLSSE